MRLVAIIFILCMLVRAVSAGDDSGIDSTRNPDYYSADNIRSFADFLKEDFDFLRAAPEYDRLRFLLDSVSGADGALYEAGLCYMYGGNTELAIARFRRLINQYQNSALVPSATFQLARASYTENRWEDVVLLTDTRDDSDSLSFLRQGLHCLALARLGRWSEAESAASIKLQNGNSPAEADELYQRICTGRKLPTKSGTKAAILSTMIPGLGKVYAGRNADGVFAFIIVGLSVWQSVRGFHEDGSSSVRGWIFGISAGTLHLGNIYGTTVSVSLYNNRLKQDYFHELEAKWVYHVP